MDANKIHLSKKERNELTHKRRERIRQIIAQNPLIRTTEIASIMELTSFVVTNIMRRIRDEFISVPIKHTAQGFAKGFIINPDFVPVEKKKHEAQKLPPFARVVRVDDLMMAKYGTKALAQPLRKLTNSGIGSTLGGGYRW